MTDDIRSAQKAQCHTAAWPHDTGKCLLCRREVLAAQTGSTPQAARDLRPAGEGSALRAERFSRQASPRAGPTPVINERSRPSSILTGHPDGPTLFIAHPSRGRSVPGSLLGSLRAERIEGAAGGATVARTGQSCVRIAVCSLRAAKTQKNASLATTYAKGRKTIVGRAPPTNNLRICPTHVIIIVHCLNLDKI